MTRVLVVGIGNIFFSDDAFGVEVARRLAQKPPAEARVAEFGIRMLHLAYELLEPVELCIVADCMLRGNAPGTLYVVEPELRGAPAGADAHSMNLPTLVAAVRQLGGSPPPMYIVGCEPAATEPGLGLSASVTRSIPDALVLIHALTTSHLQRTPHDHEHPC